MINRDNIAFNLKGALFGVSIFSITGKVSV